jgi:hypothetical protein
VRAPEERRRLVAVPERRDDLAELREGRLVRGPGGDAGPLDPRRDRVERQLRLGGAPEVVGGEVLERALERLEKIGERAGGRRRRVSRRDGSTPGAGAP